MSPGEGKEPLLALEHLWVAYNRTPIIQDLFLEVGDRQIVALVGPDGAGKTTILKAVGGLLKPLAGRIYFDGEALETLPIWEIVRRGLIYVPDGMKVFGQMTVLENLEVGAYLNRAKISEGLELVFNIFPELRERGRALAGVLSGGQQRMVTLARGLMSGARLLLLDDPFLALSPKLVRRFCDTFLSLRQRGMTLLIAGQEAGFLLKVADRGYLLEHGRVVLSGPGPEILPDPRLRELFADLEISSSGQER